MKKYGLEMRNVYIYIILRRFESFTSRPLDIHNRNFGTDSTRGWIGPRARLETVAYRKVS
jgi:hypothetical protein